MGTHHDGCLPPVSRIQMDIILSAGTSLIGASHPPDDLTACCQLAAFPWITSAPFLIVTLVIAVRDPSTIARTSPAYCTFTYPEVYGYFSRFHLCFDNTPQHEHHYLYFISVRSRRISTCRLDNGHHRADTMASTARCYGRLHASFRILSTRNTDPLLLSVYFGCPWVRFILSIHRGHH
jgi:hypothetical protein